MCQRSGPIASYWPYGIWLFARQSASAAHFFCLGAQARGLADALLGKCNGVQRGAGNAPTLATPQKARLELIDRHQRIVERRIRAAHFPAVKSLDTFDFLAIPSVNKVLVMELARCEYIERRENIIAVGNSGAGKTHVALGLGLAACQRGMSVGFTTAAALSRAHRECGVHLFR